MTAMELACQHIGKGGSAVVSGPQLRTTSRSYSGRVSGIFPRSYSGRVSGIFPACNHVTLPMQFLHLRFYCAAGKHRSAVLAEEFSNWADFAFGVCHKFHFHYMYERQGTWEAARAPSLYCERCANAAADLSLATDTRLQPGLPSEPLTQSGRSAWDLMQPCS